MSKMTIPTGSFRSLPLTCALLLATLFSSFLSAQDTDAPVPGGWVALTYSSTP